MHDHAIHASTTRVIPKFPSGSLFHILHNSGYGDSLAHTVAYQSYTTCATNGAQAHPEHVNLALASPDIHACTAHTQLHTYSYCEA